MNSSTTTRVGVIAGVAAILLAAIWYLALFRPESDHLKSAHAAHTAAVAQIQTLNGQVASLKALEKQIPQDTARLHALQQAVPNSPDLPDALGQLHNAATQSGVTLSNVSPTPPTASTASSASAQSGGTASVALSMSATGSYAQLMNFMTRLDNMARAVVVNTVSLNGGSTGSLNAAFSAQIFYAH